MTDSVARRLGGIGVIALLISGWRAFQAPEQEVAPPSAPIIADRRAPTGEAAGARGGEASAVKWSMASVIGGSETLVKEKALAEKLHVQLVSSESGELAVHASTIALLRLNPNQAHELNVSLARFCEQLRAEEVKHAYVKVSGDGSEEIVVPPFERTELIYRLIVELTDRLGAAIADFVHERLPYDFNLLAANFEMRTYIQKYADDLDREIFETTRPMKPPPIKQVTSSTVSILHDGHSFRTRHLWAAIDQLPRREPDPSKN